MLKVIEVPKFQSPFLNEFRFSDPFQRYEPLHLNEIDYFIRIGENLGMCERYYPDDSLPVTKQVCA